MIIKFPTDLKKVMREQKGKKIVYATGCFDLTHAGHVLFLEDCKSLGDILIVQVASDISIGSIKGKNRPVFNENIRLKMVDSFKPVDYCFLDGVDDFSGSLKVQEKVFKDLKPDFYVINNDASNIDSRKKLTEKYSIQMVILKRQCPPEYENISTTKIIEKIKST